MIKKVSVSGVLNSIVPISRFNKGEAHKIFDEVKQNGYGIVVKNNSPTCVLITPEIYEEMMEIVDKYQEMLAAREDVRHPAAEVLPLEQEHPERKERHRSA